MEFSTYLDKGEEDNPLFLCLDRNTWKTRCMFYFGLKYRWSMSQNKLTTNPSRSMKLSHLGSRPFYN